MKAIVDDWTVIGDSEDALETRGVRISLIAIGFLESQTNPLTEIIGGWRITPFDDHKCEQHVVVVLS